MPYGEVFKFKEDVHLKTFAPEVNFYILQINSNGEICFLPAKSEIDAARELKWIFLRPIECIAGDLHTANYKPDIDVLLSSFDFDGDISASSMQERSTSPILKQWPWYGDTSISISEAVTRGLEADHTVSEVIAAGMERGGIPSGLVEYNKMFVLHNFPNTGTHDGSPAQDMIAQFMVENNILFHILHSLLKGVSSSTIDLHALHTHIALDAIDVILRAIDSERIHSIVDAFTPDELSMLVDGAEWMQHITYSIPKGVISGVIIPMILDKIPATSSQDNTVKAAKKPRSPRKSRNKSSATSSAEVVSMDSDQATSDKHYSIFDKHEASAIAENIYGISAYDIGALYDVIANIFRSFFEGLVINFINDVKKINPGVVLGCSNIGDSINDAFIALSKKNSLGALKRVCYLLTKLFNELIYIRGIVTEITGYPNLDKAVEFTRYLLDIMAAILIYAQIREDGLRQLNCEVNETKNKMLSFLNAGQTRAPLRNTLELVNPVVKN